jgi:hypothetical protein
MARMKDIYPKMRNLKAAVVEPRVLGVIRKERGKMYMVEEKWSEAYAEFHESFRGYQVRMHAHNTCCQQFLKRLLKVKYATSVGSGRPAGKRRLEARRACKHACAQRQKPVSSERGESVSRR